MMRQKGFSIVELMIAIALSLLLGIGIFQVFTSNQQSARLTQALVEVQDTGRLSLDLIARDIRNAGYWGCAGALNRVNSTIDAGGIDYDADIHGIGIAGNQGGVSAMDDVAAGVTIDGFNVVAGTDVLQLRSMASDGLSIAKPMPTVAAALFVTDNNSFAQGDVLAVSDCQSADVFQITNVNTSGGANNLVHNTGTEAPGNTTNSLSRQYDTGSQILRPTFRSYFLNENADGVRRLMYRNESDVTTVFADNVEEFQLMFGVDSTGDGVADLFVSGTTIDDTITAGGAYDYDDVLTIDVRLRIASSTTGVVDEGILYTWNGGVALPVAIDEGRLRREFTTVSTVRSRIP
jgi:type IV pilus assembly protein PilW